MGKVFGIHMIGLRIGVKPENFEKFMLDRVLPNGLLPGVQLYLLKGDRGDRDGKYLFVYEFESVEARDRFFPAPDQASEEAERHLHSLGELWGQWAEFASLPMPPTIYTDYVAVEE